MLKFAVVPVKNLLESKSRLSSILNGERRRGLTLAMLGDVLSALKSSEVDQTIVISCDKTVHKFAEGFGIKSLQEAEAGLNQAVRQAIEWCVRKNAGAVLILPTDTPLITPDDIDTIIELGEDKTIVISPSQDGGTNALLLRTSNLIQPCFGQNSFKKHIWYALGLGVQPKIYRSKRLLDIDSEEDIEDFLKLGKKYSLTYQFLDEDRKGNNRV